MDVAPLGGVYIKRYLADYGAKGGTVLRTGIRDDASFLYAPDSVLADPAKAAAIKVYVTYWAQAQRWIKDHPQEWLKAYYEDNQGLDAADGKWLIKNAGTPVVPKTWTEGHRRAPADHRPAVGGGGPARHQGAGPVGPALRARRR